LNQKLCDIRNQTASIAIANFLDEDFRANNDISADSTQGQIKELREQYAKDCLDDKRFIFGKYTVTNDNVCNSNLNFL